MLASADVLIVRSVTRVNEQLLAGSPVRFVGTATIGTDHVERAALERRGIAFAAAPGCNARSVAEYVVAALLELEPELQRDWRGRTIGIVGVGNVGSRVAQLAAALGLRVLACDPPRAASEPGFASVPLTQILADADVVTVHVPMVRSGAHPTHHLLGAAEIARLATPHIAGYSLDGKIAGTRMIAESLQRFLGGAPAPAASIYETAVAEPRVAIAQTGRDGVRAAVRHSYAIRADDARLRAALERPSGTRGEAFDRLRRDYPVRREFASYRVGGAVLGDQRALLRALGFRLEEAAAGANPGERIPEGRQ
jgi:erythronate-4-phosphate dehydrogenase